MLAVLAALFIVAQYGFFYADVLGKNSSYRPWVLRYCELSGCTVPVLRDINKIRSDTLLVYSKPDTPGALSVDAVIINNADFYQPFPDLLLRFENLQGEAVAQRRLRPFEYLAGEMSGANMMPPNQPVRLGLTLVDPGQEAVSYSLFIQE
ncbi:MAG: DUF3426 domain-containing protein [Gammaproteobacteria bacterium]|nr:MAG: DUF3426 domain-containing protein [Gammaproteobacteria bacterium]